MGCDSCLRVLSIAGTTSMETVLRDPVCVCVYVCMHPVCVCVCVCECACVRVGVCVCGCATIERPCV